MIKNWIVKVVLFAVLKKVMMFFTKNIENVNNVILKEALDVIMKKRLSNQRNSY